MPYELEKRRIGKQAEKNLLSNNLWCRKKENKKYLFSSWWSEACEFHHGNKFYFSRKWNGAFTAKNHSLAKFCRLRRLVEFSSGSESETEATYRLICADSGFCNVNRELARRMGPGKVNISSLHSSRRLRYRNKWACLQTKLCHSWWHNISIKA